MKRRLADEKIAGGMEIMAGLAVSGALLLCLGILLLRLVVWLRFGYWSSHPIFKFARERKGPSTKNLVARPPNCVGRSYGSAPGSGRSSHADRLIFFSK